MSKPVFVVGSGRSGTTAVLKLAAASSGCEGIPRLCGAYPKLSPTTVAWMKNPLPVPGRVATPSSECIGWFEEAGFVSSGIGPELPQRWEQHRNQVAVLRHRVESWTSRSRADVTLIKSTASIVRVPALADGIPEARFVHVIRHPKGVARSLAAVGFFADMKLWWANGSTPAALVDGNHGLLPSVGLVHWHHQVSTGLAGFGEVVSDRQFEFRYETPDPGALARFLGVPVGPMVASFNGFKASEPVEIDLDWGFVADIVDPEAVRNLARKVGYEL